MDVSKEECQWWWIDYLEDELDPGLNRDLELLLEHSQEDRDSFEAFRLLRQWVRESEPSEAPDMEARLERVRAGVMARIEHLDQPGDGASVSSLYRGCLTKSFRA